MHLRLITAFVALYTTQRACGLLAEDYNSEQAVFVSYGDASEEVLQKFDTTHPIPPDRGVGFDPWNLSSLANTTFHDAYHPLFEINEYMEHLTALYPESVKMFELGHSSEGREMFVMQISSGQLPETGRFTKRGFVITGAQHAREWVASASALYIAHALASNPKMTRLLDDYDFHIIPVPNPDGYVYTWDNDRLWYKNRMLIGPNDLCQGLDMNRNWGFHWSPSEFPENDETVLDSLKKGKKGKKGKPKPKKPTPPAPIPADPCSQWYPGRRPFEAPEVNNIANYITKSPNLEAFIDLRSYGQMLSWPYSYACGTLPADAEDLYEAALGATYAIRKKHGTIYATGSLCSMLYPAPGNILDWMYGAAGIKYSYAAHLRDTGTYGYTLPQQFIRPVGEETATLIEYISDFIVKQP